MTMEERIERELDEAEVKALDALGRYKFQMFGYWAAIWVHLNRLGALPRANPFRDFVKAARTLQETKGSTYSLECHCTACQKTFRVDSRNLEGWKPTCPKCQSAEHVEIANVLEPLCGQEELV